MNSPLMRWSPDTIRRVAAPAFLRGREVEILGESGSAQKFQSFAQYADPTVNALFNLRAYAAPYEGHGEDAGTRYAADARFFSAAREASALFNAPAADALHVPTYMPNILAAYVNNVMVAPRLMPVVKVGFRSNKVAEIPMGTGLSPVDTRLAGQNAQVPELTWKVSNRGTYLVTDYGLRCFIPRDSITNADPPFEVRRRTAMILGSTLELMQEIDVAATLSTSSNYASGYYETISSSADKWNNPNSDPANAIRTGVAKILNNEGMRVKLVLGRDVYRALQAHPKIQAAIYSRPSTASGATPLHVVPEMLAQIFEVDEVVVGKAKKNTANDGAAVSMSDVWSNFAAAVAVDESPSAEAPSGFGYQFRYNNTAMDVQFIPDLLAGVRGGEHCKVTHSTDVFVVSQYNGYLWSTPL